MYDVFFSNIGVDAATKEALCTGLAAQGLTCYAADNSSLFADADMNALAESRVCLLVLTDALRAETCFAKAFPLCRQVFELEAVGKIRLAVLAMSDYFRFADGAPASGELAGAFFYIHTRGLAVMQTVDQAIAQCKALADAN